ncbi:MAG: hypothetical protein HYU37_01040 [Acidobacteria bacterium]|nr:hypothetical protein [Acidobacteriota bacterium]
MKRMLAALVAAGCCATAAQSYAHHSFPDVYSEDRTVTIQGELAQIVLRNPHSFVHVVVKEKDGSLVRYAVEWVGVTELGGQGVTPQTFKLGDYVIISGWPGRNPTEHRVRMTSLQRPSDGFGWKLRARGM